MAKNEVSKEDLLNALSSPVIEAMDEHGLTLESLLKELADQVDAKQVKAFQNDGKVIYSKPLKAWDVRQRAVELSLKLRGAFPVDKTNLNSQQKIEIEWTEAGPKPEKMREPTGLGPKPFTPSN